MAKVKDITGVRFGRLTVIEYAGIPKKSEGAVWKCQCDCGKEIIVRGSSLKSGNTQSCGCIHKEIATRECIRRNVTHGKHSTKLYRIWSGMKTRCNNPNSTNYSQYGAKGIRVCSEWENDFSAFYNWAISNGFNGNLQIDRIENDKGYYPENCRRVTQKENTRNRSITRVATYKGITKPISCFAEEHGLRYGTLLRRLQRGWNIDRALTQPTRKTD